MAKIRRTVRKLTTVEKARHAKIREQVAEEFPPAKKKRHLPVRTGIAAALRKARKSQGLTYYAVAKQAGIPNSNTVKGRSPISIAIVNWGFLEENLLGSPKTEACAGAVVE